MRFTPCEALLAFLAFAIPVCHLTGRRLRRVAPPDVDLGGHWRRTHGGEGSTTEGDGK